MSVFLSDWTAGSSSSGMFIFPCNGPPPEPWEQAGSSSGPAPFKPSSAGSTSDVVEASGTAKPGEIVSITDRIAISNRNALGRPVLSRPLQHNYGSNTNYGVVHMVALEDYMVEGSMATACIQEGMVGFTVALLGCMVVECTIAAWEAQWVATEWAWLVLMEVKIQMVLLHLHQGLGFSTSGDAWRGYLLRSVCNSNRPEYTGIAFAHECSSSVQLFDRSGLLYGELARFVLRILGIRTKPKMRPPQGPHGLLGSGSAPENRNYIEVPKAAPSGSWEKVWAK